MIGYATRGKEFPLYHQIFKILNNQKKIIPEMQQSLETSQALNGQSFYKMNFFEIVIDN